MQVILEVIAGAGTGHKIVVRSGQQLTVGRTEEADQSLPDNVQMSARHFELRCEATVCYIRDLNSRNGTFLNDERITEATLRDGDRVNAGEALFAARVEADFPVMHGVPREPSPATLDIRPAPTTPLVGAAVQKRDVPASAGDSSRAIPVPTSQLQERGFVRGSVAEICSEIEDLGDEAKAMAGGDQTPPQYVRKLENRELFQDAVRFLAHALCKRGAVGWASACVHEAAEGQHSEKDAAALKAARVWVLEPNEVNRRLAQKTAEELQHATPASWVAMGVFWADGSMAPPEAPAVPAGPHLTARAVTGAVMLAAVAKEPEKAPARYRKFLQLGVEAGSS